ncbi:MAG: hypothetical protein IJ638_00055, partial [Alphaproteobacteria bacterium]|nr:hypothetical protein [Alphaproteobacteria bacterium]
ISSDGSSSVELYDELESLCGFEVSGDSYMLNRFYQAGDYGDSNVGALEDLRLTGQNTQKRENWRQVVDATLAGYTEIAELACGAEDYKLTKVNQYALDKRTNSEMVKLYAESAEIGRQTANQIVNHWFRETDCVNSPLPVGGLYWDYKKGGNPDCKIVCKEGYAIGSNSSTCVKIEEENKETFIGLNIGNDWVGANKKVEEKKQEDPAPNNETVNNGGGSNNTPATDYCPKGTKKQLWHPSKGKDGICEVFFPKNGDGTCTHRYYCRHTGSDGEWFSTGDFRSNYDSWFDMKLNNDGDAGLNKIWGTSYSRFGNDYAELLSKDIKSYCLSRCNGVVKKDETPKQNKTYDGSVTCDEIKKVMPNYSEGYVVEFGSYVKANSDKFSSECKAINLGTVTHNGRQYPKTFYTFPKWTELYGEYTAKTMTSSSTYDSKNYMSNVKASIFASEHSVPLARAIRECVCKDEVSTTKKSSQSTTSSETSEKTSTSDDDCPLPKANAWKEAIVLKYIDFMDNSYKGMCGNRSKYINFEEYYAKNRTVPAMDFKYMKDLDNEMIEFRKCVCSDKK